MATRISADQLAHYALWFRRIGDQLVELESHQTRSPLPVGMNGGDETGTQGKRKRVSPKTPQETTGTEPPRKRLQTEAEVNRLVRDLIEMPPELIEMVVVYALQPRFLKEYTVRPDPRTWVPSSHIANGSHPDAGKWKRTHVRVHMDEAMIEVRRLSALYLKLLVTSTTVHAILSDPRTRVLVYRQWLSNASEPAWLDFDQSAPLPLKGTRFTNQDLNRFAQTIPELQTDVPNTKGWYSIFLANVFSSWIVGQMFRDNWKVACTLQLSKYFGGYEEFLWDGRNLDVDDIKRRRFPLFESAMELEYPEEWSGVGRSVWFPELLIKTQHTGGVEERGKNIWAGIGVHTHRVAEADGKFDPTGWLTSSISKDGSGGTTFLNFHDENAAASDPSTVIPMAFAQFVYRALSASNVLRIPTLSVGPETPLGRADREVNARNKRSHVSLEFAETYKPWLLFEPPLYWPDQHTVRSPRPGDDLEFWPGLKRLTLEQVRIADTQQVGHIISLVENGLTNLHASTFRFRWVLQSVRQDPAYVDLPAYFPIIPPEVLPRHATVIAKGMKMLETKKNAYVHVNDVPEYLLPYRAGILLDQLRQRTAAVEEEDDDDEEMEEDDDEEMEDEPEPETGFPRSHPFTFRY